MRGIRFLLSLTFGVAFSLVVVAAAVAADNTVVVPWGDGVAALINGLSQVLGLLLFAGILLLIGMLPAWIQDIVRPLVNTMRVNQLFEKTAAAVVGGTVGAVKGRTVEITIANDMVRNLVKTVLENGAPQILDFAGRGIESLAAKALARLQEQGVIPADYTMDMAVAAAARGSAEAAPKP